MRKMYVINYDWVPTIDRFVSGYFCRVDKDTLAQTEFLNDENDKASCLRFKSWIVNTHRRVPMSSAHCLVRNSLHTFQVETI